MKLKLISIIIVFFICFCTINYNQTNVVKADKLSDSISEQLGNLDMTELEDFFNNVGEKPNDDTFNEFIDNIINGKYDIKFDTIFGYLFNVFFNSVRSVMPTFISIIAIGIFCSIMHNIKGSFASDSVADIVIFVCLLSMIVLLTSEIISIWNNTKNTIENIAKLTEIMSPIILTLMIASGGSVSASVYKPAVLFLSTGIINIVLSIILPLIGLILVFSVISNFSDSIKISKFGESATSIIKWIIGIIITVFTIFLTVQGITSATFDGISIKAAKYAISNSVPIIGSFLKDGFDLVAAGSIIIKNSVGIAVVFALFYTIMSPVLYIASFSLLMKLTAALLEPICDVRISGFCTSVSKCITYLIVALLTVGVMLFITVLLMIFSGNALF